MRCIISETGDPYFNLASEEYLLKENREDVFLLYRNDPSLVIGKHQNAMAEINHAFVRERQIMVARRISGGGAVYHDRGNLNFTFITTGEEGKLVDYGTHARPVIQALGHLGIEVREGKRHELLLGNKKISGMASHVFKNRVLHHGTLLFRTDLEELENALTPEARNYEDRAVRSIRSDVTNIADHLPGAMDITDFQDHLLAHVLNTINGAVRSRYSREEIDAISQLRLSRYSTREWIYGYSPRYRLSRKIIWGTGEAVLQLHVEKGVIREFSIEGAFGGRTPVRHLEEALVGTFHDHETIRQRLSPLFTGDPEEEPGLEALMAALF